MDLPRLWRQHLNVRANRLTLREFAAFAKPAAWAVYQDVQTDDLDIHDPAYSEAVHRRRECVREFVAALIETEQTGEWVIEGREGEDAVNFTVIDARLLNRANFNFARNVIYVLGRCFFDIMLTQSSRARSNRISPGDQQSKEALRSKLRRWLQKRQIEGAEAQAEWQWRAEAKIAFREDAKHITKNLFHTVFKELPLGHPLKLRGRKKG